MRRLIIPVVVLATAAASVACGPRAGTLEAANDALGATQMTSIQFSGTGRWYQFGQAPNPTLPWPQFDVSSYTATVDYARSSRPRADGSPSDSRAGSRPADAGRAARQISTSAARLPGTWRRLQARRPARRPRRSRNRPPSKNA